MPVDLNGSMICPRCDSKDISKLDELDLLRGEPTMSRIHASTRKTLQLEALEARLCLTSLLTSGALRRRKTLPKCILARPVANFPAVLNPTGATPAPASIPWSTATITATSVRLLRL